MSNQRRPLVIAGIPAYNEEKYIAKIVLKTMKHVDEVIVVDDGSTDMTGEIARALGVTVVRHEKNQGYGAALATIFKEARKRGADILVILNADLQHSPILLPKMLTKAEEENADTVVASRYTKGGRVEGWEQNTPTNKQKRNTTSTHILPPTSKQQIQ